MLVSQDMVRVRETRGTEVDSLIRIWRRAVDATHDFLSSTDRAAIDAEVQTLLPTVPMWVAVDETDQAVAFMILSQAHIEALFVDPAQQRRGIGRLLVEHAITLAGALTVDVNEQNGGAIQFYQRLGFVLMGRSPEDHQGRPYALVHMQLKTTADGN